MIFDLDKAGIVAKAALPPWEFKITRNGQTYAVREITEADVRLFSALPAADEAAHRAYALDLFIEPKPDLGDWSNDELGMTITAAFKVRGRRDLLQAQSIGKQVEQQLDVEEFQKSKGRK